MKLRSGQEWDPDFALYVMNARNILDGLPYAQTPYLFNPANPMLPTAYPPGLPLLLAPVMYFVGLDLSAFKIECVCFLVAFLWVLWMIARPRIGYVPALVVTAAIGLHPFVVLSCNELSSEFPFMLACYGALLLFDRLQSENAPRQTILVRYILLASCLTAFAYLTRSIGVLLFPAAMVASIWRTKQLATPTTLALAGAIAVILAVQSQYRGDVGAYVNHFTELALRVPVTNVNAYWQDSLTMFGNGRLARGFCVLILLTAALGYFSRSKTLTVLEWYFALYLGFLIFYPIAQEAKRYSMPIWPLLFLYSMYGVNTILRAVNGLPRLVVLSVLAALFAGGGLVYVQKMRTLGFGPIPYSVTDPQSTELFRAIRSLPPEARVLSVHPTIIALYTDHVSSTHPDPIVDAEFKDYLRRANIKYIVQEWPHLAVRARYAFEVDDLDRFIERNCSSMQTIFVNSRFKMYRVGSPVRAAAAPD